MHNVEHKSIILYIYEMSENKSVITKKYTTSMLHEYADMQNDIST